MYSRKAASAGQYSYFSTMREVLQELMGIIAEGGDMDGSARNAFAGTFSLVIAGLPQFRMMKQFLS